MAIVASPILTVPPSSALPSSSSPLCSLSVIYLVVVLSWCWCCCYCPWPHFCCHLKTAQSTGLLLHLQPLRHCRLIVAIVVAIIVAIIVVVVVMVGGGHSGVPPEDSLLSSVFVISLAPPVVGLSPPISLLFDCCLLIFILVHSIVLHLLCLPSAAFNVTCLVNLSMLSLVVVVFPPSPCPPPLFFSPTQLWQSHINVASTIPLSFCLPL